MEVSENRAISRFDASTIVLLDAPRGRRYFASALAPLIAPATMVSPSVSP